jgi:hypothetical protein
MKLKRPQNPFSPLPPHVRAGQYVAKIPGAVSGSGGHNQTFSVAVALVHGFSLPEAQAWPLLMEYGATCSPPWSVPELRHKLASAVAATNHQKPRGHLLGTQAALVRYVAEEPAPRFIGRVKMPAPRPLATPAPYLSDRALADWCGVHQTTVGSVRGQVSKIDTSTDTPDQPATKPDIAEKYCPTCWSTRARALRPGHCICSGDVVPLPSSIRGVMEATQDL